MKKDQFSSQMIDKLKQQYEPWRGKKMSLGRNVEIEDNCLSIDNFKKITDLILGDKFFQIPWYYNPIVDYPDETDDLDKFQFVHIFYDNSPLYVSPLMKQLNPILDTIQPVSVYRIKANLLTKTSNIIENEFHIDINGMSDEKIKQWTTSIFYANTNDGFTEFEDGTKVESVANRMVTFPANLKHRGTSCTDEKRRVVINFNYYSKT
jgi:hypothetical protein